MTYKAIFEYEYPCEHKPPVKADIYLHGNKVSTRKIKPFQTDLEKIKAEIREKSYCDDCILVDICGSEGCYDESLTFCADKHRYILKSELKDIKAEIDDIEEPDHDFEGFYYRFNEVMKILDKHIKENKQ